MRHVRLLQGHLRQELRPPIFACFRAARRSMTPNSHNHATRRRRLRTRLIIAGRVGRGFWRPTRILCFFTVCRGHVGRFIRTPINRIQPSPHEAVESRIWPIRNPLHQSVLHRIIMNILHVTPQVIIVANPMFPEPPLPDVLLAAAPARRAGRPTRPLFTTPGASEAAFNQPPTHGKVAVILRQTPKNMQMIRQQDKRYYLEVIIFSRPKKCRTKQPAGPNPRQQRPPMGSDDREEECATSQPDPPIVTHKPIIICWYERHKYISTLQAVSIQRGSPTAATHPT